MLQYKIAFASVLLVILDLLLSNKSWAGGSLDVSGKWDKIKSLKENFIFCAVGNCAFFMLDLRLFRFALSFDE